jgi:tetratricopeptide (TPR) repeat protein
MLGILIGTVEGDLRGAEEALREALRIQRKCFGDHIETFYTLITLSGLPRIRGDFADAEALAREAIAMGDRILPYKHLDRMKGWRSLAKTMAAIGDWGACEEAWQITLAVIRNNAKATSVDLGDALWGVGQALIRQEEFCAAQPYFRECLEVRCSYLLEGDWTVAQTEVALAGCLRELGEIEEAERLLFSALDKAYVDPKVADARSHEVLEGIFELYEDWTRQRASNLQISKSP